MGIFSRLTDIMNSNLNALLDRAEDPEKLIRLVIQEMEDTLVEVRSASVGMIAERKRAERSLITIEADQGEWQRKAEFALSRGREDLAKGALQAKARLQSDSEAAQRHVESLSAALAEQSENIAKLQAKLDDAKRRQAALVSRSRSAGTKLKLQTSLHDQRMTDAFARFEQMERHVDVMEGRAEAIGLGRNAGQGRSLAEDFANLEADEGVEAELAALKAKLQGA